MDKVHRILVIIPKTNVTVIGIFHNERCIFKDELFNSSFDNSIIIELEKRRQHILKTLEHAGINLSKLDNVTAVGGLIKSVKGGTYLVNSRMTTDLKNNLNGTHASNLGGLLAKRIADDLNIQAFIVDPPVVDEMDDLAKYTGLPHHERQSVFHALNQKAIARKVSNMLNKSYSSTQLIVAHLGHGISIGAHRNGKVIDVNNGLHGEGPFSFERAGTLPSKTVLKLCYNNPHKTEQTLSDKLSFNSGMKAYLGIKHLTDIKEKLNTDKDIVHQIFQAMAYQVAKEIGSMSVVLKGEIDGIVLTGNLSHYAILTDAITERVNWISDIYAYPGEMELEALCEGALRILNNKESLQIYE